jgi:hypothetical protein
MDYSYVFVFEEVKPNELSLHHSDPSPGYTLIQVADHNKLARTLPDEIEGWLG